jgi:hypothetical protein
MLEFRFDPQAGLRQALGQHLWASSILDNGGQPFSVRAIPSEKSAILCCRTWQNGKEHTLVYDAVGWKPLDAKIGVDPSVLLTEPGQWTWRMRERGHVTVDFDPTRFHMSKDDPLFSRGTLAFWDIDAAAGADGQPLAVAKDWFVATAGGILRLAGDKLTTRAVYARNGDGDGDSLLNLTHVAAGSQGLFARAGSKVYRYDADKDDWVTAAEADYPGRDRPVESAWLTWTAPQGGPVRVGFRRDHSDGDALPGLLSDGRFRFDAVRDVAWHDDYWLITDAGVVRLAADGAMHHHGGQVALPPDQLHGLKSNDGGLYLVANDNRVWRLDSPKDVWETSVAALAGKLREVARNELFTCRRLGPGDYEYEFLVGDKPVFSRRLGMPPMLAAGQFGFDDLRDVAFEGEKVLVSTRLGLWRYDLASPTAHIPDNAYFYARSGQPEPAPMADLGSFLRTPARAGEMVVFSRDSQRAFGRADDGAWELRPPPSTSVVTERDLPDDGRTGYRLRNEPGRIVIERLRGGQVIGQAAWPVPGSPVDLLQPFETKTSIWIPLGRQVLWVRKSAL